MPHKIRDLRLLHADLCQIIMYVDSIFAPLAIFFHGGTVAGFCGETIRLIERYSKGVDSSESLSLTSVVLSLAFLVIVIPLVTISTAEICDCPRKSIQAVNKLLQEQGTLDVAAGTHQIRLFLSQMYVKDVQMTAWRFYKLDRAALMTTYGASVSYVSLVLQSTGKV
ncbi:uncharacterized protein LOC100907580 [Galendromus occidentalis]|uniref:Uncharacterized protein LOC100907580 n=1 Tax=Galendromus occidentalis TaxID=34638 RepID=A0AAJ6W002_9ACAR|nr:uncharacterized protein LOC100907580 [Galendromus occidentalis]